MPTISKISLDGCHDLAHKLVDLLVEKDVRPEAIVAITRGGLGPTQIIASRLNVRLIDTLCVETYADETRLGEPRLLKGLHLDIVAHFPNGRGVLVVEDLADTGTTLAFVRNMLPEAHFAALFAKPKGESLLDTFVEQAPQDVWINFPWEVDPEKPLVRWVCVYAIDSVGGARTLVHAEERRDEETKMSAIGRLAIQFPHSDHTFEFESRRQDSPPAKGVRP